MAGISRPVGLDFPPAHMASISSWFASTDEDVLSQQPHSCQHRRVLPRWRATHGLMGSKEWFADWEHEAIEPCEAVHGPSRAGMTSRDLERSWLQPRSVFDRDSPETRRPYLQVSVDILPPPLLMLSSKRRARFCPSHRLE